MKSTDKSTRIVHSKYYVSVKVQSTKKHPNVYINSVLHNINR